MKQILVAFVLFFITLSAKSQIEKGNWLVGGNGGYTSNKNASTDLRTRTINLAPNIGYFIVNKLATGLKCNAIFQNDSYYSNGDGVKTQSFVFGPFFRYYFLKEEKVVNLFFEGNYAYGVYKKTGVYPINGGKLTQYSFLLGSAIYFNSNVGLEFTGGYYNNKDITENIINSGLRIGIGFQIHLKK